MCGRFTLTLSAEKIAESFELSKVPEHHPRYNIAPSQLIAAIVAEKEKENQLKSMRWGLIPSWAKDTKIGNKLINARAETLTEKPSFRSAFKKRRCLIIADGFYEWQKQEKHKQPYYIQLESRQPFAFAGLWETWQPKDAGANSNQNTDDILSCTIITTEANDLMRSIHDRMPVILSPEHYQQWLDPTSSESEDLLSILKPYDKDMVATPVSQTVNKPTNDDPECVKPISFSSNLLKN